MTERSFPALHVASAVSGVSLCDGLTVARMGEVMSWVLGYPVWTHEIVYAPIKEQFIADARRALPEIPSREAALQDWQKAARHVTLVYGETVLLRQGQRARPASPLATADAVMEPTEP